jgi:hypothetical protein
VSQNGLEDRGPPRERVGKHEERGERVPSYQRREVFSFPSKLSPYRTSQARDGIPDQTPFRSGLGWAGSLRAYLGAAVAVAVGDTSVTAPASCASSIQLLSMRPTNTAPITAPTKMSSP